MASLLVSATNSRGTREGSKDEVYVAAMALRATKGPAQFLMSTAYSLNLGDLQHFMVLIKPSLSPPHSQVLVCDFQPQDPEDIFVALAALSGKKIPGVVMLRKLKMLPKRKCWFVGYSTMDALNAAHRYNERWETYLSIGHHDCRNYTDVENIELEECKQSKYDHMTF